MMSSTNAPKFVFGPHPTDDEIMGINITEGKYKDVFFSYGKVTPIEETDGTLRLDYAYDIIGFPDHFSVDDFVAGGKESDEFDVVTGDILASLLEEQVSKLSADLI